MNEERNFITVSFKIFKKQNRFSRMSGAVFAEGFNLSLRNLLEKPVFERGYGNWIDVLPVIPKHNNNKIQSSTKLTPI